MGNDELFRNRSGINRTVAAKTLPLSVNYDPGYSGISGLSLSTVDLPLVSRRCCYYLLFCLREKRIKSRNFDESEPERDMVLPPDCDWTSSPMTNAGICDMVVVGLVKKDPTKPETQDRKKGGAVLNEPKHQIYGGRG